MFSMTPRATRPAGENEDLVAQPARVPKRHLELALFHVERRAPILLRSPLRATSNASEFALGDVHRRKRVPRLSAGAAVGLHAGIELDRATPAGRA